MAAENPLESEQTNSIFSDSLELFQRLEILRHNAVLEQKIWHQQHASIIEFIERATHGEPLLPMPPEFRAKEVAYWAGMLAREALIDSVDATIKEHMAYYPGNPELHAAAEAAAGHALPSGQQIRDAASAA